MQARSQDFTHYGEGGARQTRIGQTRVTTTYAHPEVVVILTVLDSKLDKEVMQRGLSLRIYSCLGDI